METILMLGDSLVFGGALGLVGRLCHRRAGT